MPGSFMPLNEDFSSETERLHFALQAAGIGTWNYYAQTQEVWCNNLALSLLGYSGTSPIPLFDFLACIHSEDQNRILEILQSPAPSSFDVEFRTKEKGYPRRLKGNCLVQGNHQEVTGIIEELQLFSEFSRNLSELAFHNKEVGFCIVNLKNDSIEYSPSYAWLMTGNAAAKPTRSAFVHYIHPEDELLRQSAYSAIIETGQIYYEPRVVWDDGSIHRIRVRGNCFYDGKGKPDFFKIIITTFKESSLQQSSIDIYTRFQTLISASPIATGLVSGEDLVLEIANEAMFKLLNKGRGIIGKPCTISLADWTNPDFLQDLQRVHLSRQAYTSPELPVTSGTNQATIHYYQFHYTPLLTETGQAATLIVAIDVSNEVYSRLKLENSQRQLLSYFEQSPVAIAIVQGSDLTFQMANPFYGELVGRHPDQLIGKSLLEALPELAGQGFDQTLREVMTTGVPFIAKETGVTLVRNGILDTIYVDLNFQPQYKTGSLPKPSEVTGILVVATHVTEQVKARRIVEASEARLRSIIATAPAAMALFVGPEYIIELPNQAFIDIVGKGPDIEGRPLLEVMPEIRDQSTPRMLELVYKTGVMQKAFGHQVHFVKNGVMTHNYYNSNYAPLRDENGEIYAILDIAIDVTEVVVQRQNAIEAQTNLLGAVELAELGTWEMNLHTEEIIFSDRLRQWYGFEKEEVITPESSFRPVRESDVPRLKEAIAGAFLPNGSYDVEYTLEAIHTGTERILHAQGKIFYDSEGQPYKISGTARDVTKQRKIQFSLEGQVQEQTEELAAANEELMNTNEKLAITVDELAESNLLLMRSNESLEQFAYIASHDLQEPLRKIQQFGDLLKKKFQPTAKDELVYLNRMQDAASRMSLLIHDLLTFSRISSHNITLTTVSLNETFEQVRENLSVIIEESNAQIRQDDLPSMQGDASQLRQLFQNLLSNALKFSRRDASGNSTIPVITITYQKIQVRALPSIIKPIVQASEYHQIDIQDNGIGFDEQYRDRIFQVFQRLHGKNEFAGTGVGLAICQNVVNNHGGAITARSVLGEGSVFSVYFPAY